MQFVGLLLGMKISYIYSFTSNYAVSTHYVVEQNGEVTQMAIENEVCSLVRDIITANSNFKGRPDPNVWCIGIQFSRNVKNDNVMPEVQIAAGVRLICGYQTTLKKGIHLYHA